MRERRRSSGRDWQIGGRLGQFGGRMRERRRLSRRDWHGQDWQIGGRLGEFGGRMRERRMLSGRDWWGDKERKEVIQVRRRDGMWNSS